MAEKKAKLIDKLCGRLLVMRAIQRYFTGTCFALFFPVKSVAKSSQGIGDKTVLFSCTYHSIMAIFLSLSFALMKCNLKNCARQIVGFLLERPRCLAQNFKYFVLIKIFLISLSLFGGIYVLYVHL